MCGGAGCALIRQKTESAQEARTENKCSITKVTADFIFIL